MSINKLKCREFTLFLYFVVLNILCRAGMSSALLYESYKFITQHNPLIFFGWQIYSQNKLGLQSIYSGETEVSFKNV